MRNTLFLLLIIFALPFFAQKSDSLLSGYLNTYQYQKALEYIDTLEPSPELNFQKALCYKALRDYKKAVKLLVPLSQEWNDNIQVKSELATCYEALAQRSKSLDCYADLIRLDSLNAYFRIQKADLLYQDTKYEEALAEFSDVYDRFGLSSMLKRSAQCFEKMNQLDSAMLYYKSAWDADIEDSFAAASLINLCLKTKNMHQAMAYSELYLEKDSTNNQINLLNALSYYSLDLYEEAITRLQKCYQKGDSSLIVNRSLGFSYYSMNDSYEAQPFLERAFRQDTTNNEVLYCLAVTCNDMAEHKKAIPHFKKLLERTIPSDLVLYLYYRGLAMAYNKGSHYQDAADSYALALNYAGDQQKMNILYTIANLYDTFIKDHTKTLEYFKQYKQALFEYSENVKQKDPPDLEHIRHLDKKLKELDQYIQAIEKGTKVD